MLPVSMFLIEHVFSVLNHFIDPGQIEKVREALPEDVRRIWPESKPRAGDGMGSGA